MTSLLSASDSLTECGANAVNELLNAHVRHWMSGKYFGALIHGPPISSHPSLSQARRLFTRARDHTRRIRLPDGACPAYHSPYQLVDNEYAELWIFNKFTLPRTVALESDAILNNKIQLITIFPLSTVNYDANSSAANPDRTLRFESDIHFFAIVNNKLRICSITTSRKRKLWRIFSRPFA